LFSSSTYSKSSKRENFPSPCSVRKSVKNRGREQKLSPRVSSFVSLPFSALVAVCVCVFGQCKERKEKAKETKKRKK
jgi:mannitol-specific phosphotransferase system IIBC component